MIVLTGGHTGSYGALSVFPFRVSGASLPEGTKDDEVLLRLQRDGNDQGERGWLLSGLGSNHRGVTLIRMGLGKPSPISVQASYKPTTAVEAVTFGPVPSRVSMLQSVKRQFRALAIEPASRTSQFSRSKTKSSSGASG